jgi:aldehyde:ferredoxin oxidoreductase
MKTSAASMFTTTSWHPTCHACHVACKKEVELTEDPYKGLRMECVEYESDWALGANAGHHNINAVAKLIDQCNEYGLDTIELGNLYSTYMEMSEKGVMNGDLVLSWGDWDRMVELTELIANREGIGDALAEDPARFAEKYDVPELSNNVKGMSIPAYDSRGLKGMGIGYATSNRGACHGEGSDTLPDRLTEEASDMPGSLGHVCELDFMLKDYYSARGWENGAVPEEKLREVGVDEGVF